MPTPRRWYAPATSARILSKRFSFVDFCCYSWRHCYIRVAHKFHAHFPPYSNERENINKIIADKLLVLLWYYLYAYPVCCDYNLQINLGSQFREYRFECKTIMRFFVSILSIIVNLAMLSEKSRGRRFNIWNNFVTKSVAQYISKFI